jgi:CubicO group peptidase (beta-lactamase class C family)
MALWSFHFTFPKSIVMSKLPFLILPFFFFYCQTLHSQTADQGLVEHSEIMLESADQDDLREKINQIEAIVERQERENHFEGNILIAEKGEIIYQESIGFRDRTQQLLHERDTRFSIASITKMITAIVILQLLEEEQLTIETTLQDLLPEFNIPKQEKISIHHLLLHISGLPNEPSQTYSKQLSPTQFVESLLKTFKKNKSFGKFNYANIDYVLLGLIIEKITGQSWQEVIKERIINRLGLGATGFLGRDNYPENFAQSYTLDGDVFMKDPAFFVENFYAAACMYSTTEDLLKIDQAMYATTLLSKTSKELMFTSYPEYNYTGYSVWTYQYPFVDTQPRIMERRGGIMGANSVILRLLDTKTTIIILSNNDAFDPDSFGDPTNFREALIAALAK